MTRDNDNKDPLAEARWRIDALDTELVALLNKRAELSLEVGRIKRRCAQALGPENGEPAPSGPRVLKPFREHALLNALTAKNRESGPLPDEHLVAIYREILSSSRALQAPERMAFLGPEGTFSHHAVTCFLGRSVETLCSRNLEGVFRAVADNACELGMVPLENSLHGTVGESLDLFLRYEARIVSELYLRVRHCLISAEERVADVRTVFSHPQPLAQCSNWLKAHLPGARLIPVESTAAAAVRVASEMGGAAAIGHEELATRANLRVLARNIENESRNWTRFVLIAARATEAPAEANKTSVLFTVPDEPGTLAAVLDILAGENVNMKKLESRPLPGQPWKYAFFVDLQFTGDIPAQERVLEAMTRRCLTLRVLGRYPEGRVVDALPAGDDIFCSADFSAKGR